MEQKTSLEIKTIMPETEDTPEGAVHSTLVGLFLHFGKKCSIMRISPVEDNVVIEGNES